MIPPGLAVVTGASAGIGREFSVQLAQRGHDLLVVARDGARLDALAAELETRFKVRVEPFAADLSRENEIERVAGRIAAAGELSLLVNNAGFGTRGTLLEADPERQAQMLRLHTVAPMKLTRAALPALVGRRAGAVINVSSVASFIYSAGNANYCATKAYLTTFTEGIAAELKGTGVQAQALCPGFTVTEFHQRKAERPSTLPTFLWLSAETVVRDSLRSLERGGPTICVPGLGYRLLVCLIRVMPRRLLGARFGLKRG
ncbi:MAG TPA: SDR family oxidoreductase [Myxococcaceae bacterium]